MAQITPPLPTFAVVITPNPTRPGTWVGVIADRGVTCTAQGHTRTEVLQRLRVELGRFLNDEERAMTNGFVVRTAYSES
jgi:predicted RNase H-like HicB family nuclease